ncbi:MAG: hypothetical protein CL536_04825, partial [Alcaligenaceae bacterium]|nr:hypothetical protein [Alcaligenaceae bacterium]
PRKAGGRRKPVFFDTTGFVETPIYNRQLLRSGNRITGPALIEEHASTTVISPSDRVVVDDFGNLDITIGERT